MPFRFFRENFSNGRFLLSALHGKITTCCMLLGCAVLSTGPLGADGKTAYDTLVARSSPLVHLNLNESSGPTAVDASGHANSGGFGSNVNLSCPAAGSSMGTAVANAIVPRLWMLRTITSNPYLVKIAGSSSLVLGDSDFTIEMWFDEKSPSDKRSDLLAYEIGTDLGIILNNEDDGGSPGSIKSFDGGTVSAVTAPGIVQPDAWHLLDVVRSHGQVTLYLDAQKVPLTSGDSVADDRFFDYDPENPGAVFIGSGKDVTKAYYNPNVVSGMIDEFAIYRNALSPGVILSHYQAKN